MCVDDDDDVDDDIVDFSSYILSNTYIHKTVWCVMIWYDDAVVAGLLSFF